MTVEERIIDVLERILGFSARCMSLSCKKGLSGSQIRRVSVSLYIFQHSKCKVVVVMSTEHNMRNSQMPSASPLPCLAECG